MLLALDIGNTAVKGGLFDGGRLEHTFRLDVPDETAAYQWRLGRAVEEAAVTRVGLASVMPEVTPAVRAAVCRLTACPVEVIHPRLALPFRLGYETPDTLGTDRLAAAAAAWLLFRPKENTRGVVAIDAGTAVTYDVVDAAGTYRGGAIGAGPQLLHRALREGTAQLPAVSPAAPARAIGRSTLEALQSGVTFGFIDSARGMIERLRSELPAPPALVLTGGWSALLSRHLDVPHRVEPHLVLHGIRLLLEMNGTCPD